MNEFERCLNINNPCFRLNITTMPDRCRSLVKTIGFGDLVPHREVSKLVAIFFVPIGVAMMGQILGA